MSKYIKLTKDYNGKPVWIRKDAISSITENGEKTNVYVWETLSPKAVAIVEKWAKEHPERSEQ